MKGGRDIWKMIKKLKGGNQERVRVNRLFGEDGEEIAGEEHEEAMGRYWRGIYGKHKNTIQHVWNQEKRQEYEDRLISDREREGNKVELWLPKLGDPYRNIRVMTFQVGGEEVKRALARLKNGRAGGRDGLKPELYKELGGSKICVGAMAEAIRGVIIEGGEPGGWEKSRTLCCQRRGGQESPI